VGKELGNFDRGTTITVTKLLSLIRIVAVLVLLHLTACAQNPYKSAPASTPSPEYGSVIIDSALSFEQAIGSQTVPEAVRADLVLMNVRYYAFDGREHQGQLLIHKDLRPEIEEIFIELAKSKFPVAKVIPLSCYGFSDELSMEDNNTSGFNYRSIADSTKLSNHALGRAVDINPLLNPYIRNEIAEPHGAHYDPNVPGTIVADGVVVTAFKKRGWSWGGDWNSLKDYQHFEKPRK
jgi:peptidoglycan L-alanyl-D-glutamate endopeptidase CwlK